MYGRPDVVWKGDWLYQGRRRLVCIVPDGKWPGMWRVKHPNGTISDRVNRTRAKDAAVLIALRMLNQTVPSERKLEPQF